MFWESAKKIAQHDVQFLELKDKSYGSSWKKRGGIGAFMMLARKWDRLEAMMLENGYDVFKPILAQPSDGRDGTVLAEVRDLRRYLLLVETEMMLRMHGPKGFNAPRKAQTDQEMVQVAGSVVGGPVQFGATGDASEPSRNPLPNDPVAAARQFAPMPAFMRDDLQTDTDTFLDKVYERIARGVAKHWHGTAT